MSDPPTNAGYDAAIDAIAAGRPYALVCPAGHHSLPPARVCPTCGKAPLEETALPVTGELVTYNVTHVPTPAFAEDTPFVLGIAAFDSVRLTGRVQAPADAVSIGMSVVVDVDTTTTTGQRTLVFAPHSADP